MRIVVLFLVFAMIAAACGDSTSDTTEADTPDTTAPPETTPPETTPPETTPPDPAFEGYVLDSGGCGREMGYNDEDGNPVTYNGRVDTITALDEFTVEFKLCGPHPAFLAQIAFGVFGIQAEEHLQATGGAPLDNMNDAGNTANMQTAQFALGGIPCTFEVNNMWLKPDRMSRLGISPTDVFQAVKEQNLQAPAGQIGARPSPKEVEKR